jgi:hypothetical protein
LRGQPVPVRFTLACATLLKALIKALIKRPTKKIDQSADESRMKRSKARASRTAAYRRIQGLTGHTGRPANTPPAVGIDLHAFLPPY